MKKISDESHINLLFDYKEIKNELEKLDKKINMIMEKLDIK